MNSYKEQTIIRNVILGIILLIFVVTAIYAFLFLNKIFISEDELGPTFLKYANYLWSAVILQASIFIFWIVRKLFKVNKVNVNQKNQISEILDSLEWIDNIEDLNQNIQELRNSYLGS